MAPGAGKAPAGQVISDDVFAHKGPVLAHHKYGSVVEHVAGRGDEQSAATSSRHALPRRFQFLDSASVYRSFDEKSTGALCKVANGADGRSANGAIYLTGPHDWLSICVEGFESLF